MANKANKDGVDFQQHLYFYLIGMYHQHKDREYFILYEGDDAIYGAWDDVIVKEEGSTPGLFFFQAKQVLNSTKIMSLDDLFDMKQGIVKYIRSFASYLESPQFRKDGAPNEVIYWTSQGIHESTKRVLQPCQDTRLPLQSLGPISNMYRIEDWKTLVLFDIAWKWAIICNPKAESKHCPEYICYAVANRLAGEILEADKDGKVRFREAFLLGNPEFLASASNQVQAFREQFQLACPLQQRKNQLDLKQFKDSTFEEKLFGLQKNWSNTRADSDQFEHRYEHNKKTRILDEGTLAQFFQAFRYYTNVPKGEDMVKILGRLFDDNFDEKLFEKYLIPKQIANKKAQPDRYIDRNQVNSVIELIKLKKQYTAQGISGVLFTKESSLQLQKCLKEFVDQKEEDRLLNIVAPYALDWTAYRVQKELRNISTCIVIMEKHVPLVNDKLSLILETHIASEIGTLVVTGVNSLDQQNLTNLRQKVKRIVLISTSATADDDVFEDTLSDEHVTLDFAQFEHLQMRLDGRTLPLKIVEEQFQSVQSRAELFNLKSPIVVKSDLYVPEQRLNIYRTLIDDQQKKITNEQLKDRMQNRVTVIIGPNCQGKSNDLLQIANHLNEGDAICLFFNAQIIAAHCAKHNEVLEASVPLNGWDIFIKLLQITPSSDVIKDIVVQHLAQIQQLYVAVDELDELAESWRGHIISVIQKLIDLRPLTVIIAASMQLKRTLEASFNRIDFYTSSIADVLGELSLYNRFSQLPTIGQDLGSLICDLDDSGLLSFLSRIADNCGVGTLYDELIATRFDSAMRCFGSVHSKPVSVSAIYNAIQLPKKYFYEQHSSLAYDIECGEEVNEKEYENLVVYGFVRRNSIRGDSSKRNLEFIHESIRYYFFARYFLMHDVESTYFNQYMKQYFLVSKAKRGAEFVDIFLNSCESLCKQFRSKIRRFLEQNPQQLATYIQYTLNNEAFKTLDVLLDEASMKAIKRLEFRFREIEASKKNNVSNDVNLVYVESNQLWRLLKVLVKEYPTDGDKRSSKLTLGLHPQQEVWGNITEGELETLLQDMTGESEDSEAAQLLDDVCNEALCVWNIGSEDWKACVEQRYGVTLAVAEVGVVKVMLMIMAGGFALCMLIIAEALADRKWNSWAAAGLYLLVKVTGVLVVTAYLVHEMKFNRKALRAIKIRHVETVARDSEKTPGL